MKRFLSALCAGLLLHAQAWSVTGTEEMLFQDIPIVFTASKKAEKITDAPAMVVTVSREEIRRRGYGTLLDLMRDLPGMELQEFRQSEYGTLVPVRGVEGNNKIVVLVDGVRVNPPGGEQMMFRQDISVRNAEQVEVIYGPGSALYGQDAISAVINIISKKAEEGLHAEAGAGVGTPWRKEGWLNLSKKGAFGSLQGMVQYYDADLMDISKEYPGFWKRSVAGLAVFGKGNPPDRWDRGLNASLRYGAGNFSMMFWHRYSSRATAETFTAFSPATSDAKWEDTSTVVELKNTDKKSDALTTETSIVYNRYEILPKSRYLFSGSRLPGTFDYKYGLGQSTSLEQKFLVTPNENTSFVGGLVATNYDVIPKSTTLNRAANRSADFINQAGSIDYYTVQGDANSKVTIARSVNLKYQVLAAYLEGSWRPASKLKLIAGGRLDKNTRFKNLPFSPRLSAIYNLTDSLTAKYIYTRAFIAVPPFAQSVFLNTQLRVPSSALSPETSESNELNLTYDTSKLNLGVSAYYSQQKNLTATENTSEQIGVVYLSATTTTQTPLVQAVSAGRSRSNGVDFYGKARMGNIAPWFSYSYTDFHSISNSGVRRQLNWASRNVAHLGLTWDAASRLSLTLAGFWKSTPSNQSQINAGFNGYAAYQQDRNIHENPHRLDAYALFKASNSLDVYANVKNVSNFKGSTIGQVSFFETMSSMVGMKYSF